MSEIKDLINKHSRLQIARAKLSIAQSLINAALPEIIGENPDYSNSYIQIQKSFDEWRFAAHQKLIEIEKELNS